MSTTVNPDMGDSADLVAVWAARAADEKLGEDITVINVSQILGVCDWFVMIIMLIVRTRRPVRYRAVDHNKR